VNLIILICQKCYATCNAYHTLFLLPGFSLTVFFTHAVPLTAELTASHFLQIYYLYNYSQETGLLKRYVVNFIKHSLCLWMLRVTHFKTRHSWGFGLGVLLFVLVCCCSVFLFSFAFFVTTKVRDVGAHSQPIHWVCSRD